MATNTDTPQGYKATALGIIPQEWEIVRFGKVMKCFSGGTPKSSNPDFFGGKIPFIKSGEIHLSTTEQNLSEEGLNQSAAKMVNKGDLLYALYGANSGDCAISKIEGAINQAILCIRTDAFDIPYLLAVLELNRPYYTDVYLQGGQGNLSAEIVKSYMIAVPPLAEQRKIAEVLGVWDEAIEKQARLIEKLALRKRGLMQRLLSAKLRLPGFSEPWKKVKLGDVASIKTGNKNNEDKIANGQYPFFVRSSIVERINTYSYDGEAILIPGEGKIGEIIHYINGKFDYHQRVYKISDFSNCSGLFLYYYLMYFFGKQAINNSVKACVDSLRLSTFTNMTIIHPPISEQTAIAEVLTAADREIELAKEKLERLRRQKRGLMQQLLTGKKRVNY